MSCQALCRPNIDCEEIHSLLFHIPIYHNPRSVIANMPYGEQVLPPAHKRGPTYLPDCARSSEGKHPQRLQFAFDHHQMAIVERKAASGFVSVIRSLDCLQVIHTPMAVAEGGDRRSRWI